MAWLIGKKILMTIIYDYRTNKCAEIYFQDQNQI